MFEHQTWNLINHLCILTSFSLIWISDKCNSCIYFWFWFCLCRNWWTHLFKDCGHQRALEDQQLHWWRGAPQKLMLLMNQNSWACIASGTRTSVPEPEPAVWQGILSDTWVWVNAVGLYSFGSPELQQLVRQVFSSDFWFLVNSCTHWGECFVHIWSTSSVSPGPVGTSGLQTRVAVTQWLEWVAQWFPLSPLKELSCHGQGALEQGTVSPCSPGAVIGCPPLQCMASVSVSVWACACACQQVPTWMG